MGNPRYALPKADWMLKTAVLFQSVPSAESSRVCLSTLLALELLLLFPGHCQHSLPPYCHHERLLPEMQAGLGEIRSDSL